MQFNFNLLKLLPVHRHSSSILFSPVLFTMVYDSTTRTIPLPFIHHCRFFKPQSTGNWSYFHHYINRIYCVPYTHSQTLSIKLIYSQDHLQVPLVSHPVTALTKQGQWDSTSKPSCCMLQHVLQPASSGFCCSFAHNVTIKDSPPEYVMPWTAELKSNAVTSGC